MKTAPPDFVTGWADAPTGGGGGMNLDYLGAYTTPKTYNDGDIVIGADGIAYLCVVDGTTTPPEPWPGVGIATSVGPPGPPGPPGADAAIVSDAKYWTAGAHAVLSAERNLAALANGYVKSTAGEPSTVAVIPVAEGGTGATAAAAARSNLGVGNVGTLNLPGGTSTFLRADGQFAAIPDGMPSGAIILSLQAACPPGYTRIATMDGYFPRSNSVAGGSGGASSHQHGVGSYAAPGHAHDAGTLATASHSHGGRVDINLNTSDAGSHGHSFSGSGTASGTTSQASHGNPAGGGSAFTAGNVDHTHTYNANVDISGSTGGVGDHHHNVSGFAGISGDAPAVSGSTGVAGALAITGASDLAVHTPLFVDFLFCQKN